MVGPDSVLSCAVIQLLQIKPQIPELDPENEEFCVFTRATTGVSTAEIAAAAAAVASDWEPEQQHQQYQQPRMGRNSVSAQHQLGVLIIRPETGVV